MQDIQDNVWEIIASWTNLRASCLRETALAIHNNNVSPDKKKCIKNPIMNCALALSIYLAVEEKCQLIQSALEFTKEKELRQEFRTELEECRKQLSTWCEEVLTLKKKWKVTF
jgi:hypothetical protein